MNDVNMLGDYINNIMNHAEIFLEFTKEYAYK